MVFKNGSHQSLIDRHYDLELKGSSSLNTRGTTLAALSGTTIALVATLVVRVMSDRDLSTGLLVAIGCLFAIGLSTLLVSVAFALTATRPNNERSEKLERLVTDLDFEPQPDVLRSATLAALWLQRKYNDKKAKSMRTAYWFMGIGLSAVVAATALYGIALAA